MTWTITTTTTISASRAVTLAERIPGEPIKFIVLHPGTGAGGTITIWDDLGRSVASTRIDALSPRHEAEFFSDRSIFNVSAAIDGNAALSGAGVSVYLVSREAPDASVADGSTSFAGQVVALGVVAAEAHYRPLRRIAIIGDSVASSGSTGGFLEFAIMACGGQLSRVVNAGIGGNTLAQMDARFVADLQPFAPDEIWISGGLNSTELTAANKAAWASMVAKARNMSARPVIFAISPRTTSPVTRVDAMNNWLRAFCASAGVEFCDPWDVVRVQATGLADASKLDGLGIHPIPSVAWAAGSEYGASRVQAANRRRGAGLNTNGDASQNSWVVDPYNTTGDAAKGSRWTADNASVTFSKVATTSPDFGVWQRMAVSLAATAGANSGAAVSAPGGLAIPAGTEVEISYRLKTSSMSGLAIDCYLEWQNDGLVDVGGGRKSFLSTLRADVDGVVSYILKAPAGAYRPQLKFKFTQTVDGAAATGSVDVAMIAIRSLAV